jgi:colicin import membrane protein
MPRKLKTYQTSVGFFDLAIAAPSMKAALEAWGARSNLFHQGFASEVTDRRLVDATMKKPGTVLKRPVGSNQPFQEHPDLPSDLPARKRRTKSAKPFRTAEKSKSPAVDEGASRKAALAFEKQRQRREAAQRKAEAAEAKKRERRRQVAARAQAALESASREHDTRLTAIDRERAKLERRQEQEDQRWEKLKKRLDSAVRRAAD